MVTEYGGFGERRKISRLRRITRFPIVGKSPTQPSKVVAENSSGGINNIFGLYF